ncbi:MAG: hypothetical protein LBM61_04480 [Prevotellaceae bacterium]|jgi:hypothetical protein|nr:hypothetical protein [Prevotellaceae bacterium]
MKDKEKHQNRIAGFLIFGIIASYGIGALLMPDKYNYDVYSKFLEYAYWGFSIGAIPISFVGSAVASWIRPDNENRGIAKCSGLVGLFLSLIYSTIAIQRSDRYIVSCVLLTITWILVMIASSLWETND